MKSEIELKFIGLVKQSPKTKEEVAEMQRLGKLFVIELRQEIKELSEELRVAGSKYTDPWDMVNTKERYPEAIDILIKHIKDDCHDKNKEGIFRALTVKEARGKANKALLEEFERIPKEKDNLRWVIANTFYTIILPEDVDEIISIIDDKTNGKSRHRFTTDLGAIKIPKVEDFLINLLDNEELCVYALEALARLKSLRAVKKVDELVNSGNKDIRKQAQITLTKLKK